MTVPEAAASALRAERGLVIALGGFALEIAGAELLTHEKIPGPTFNVTNVRAVSPERQAGFFERALDHYFQRAIRPSFRLPTPVPDHLDAGLRRFSFRRRDDPLAVWVHRPRADDPGRSSLPVLDASADADGVAAFWSEPKERPELRAALEIAVHHPAGGERVGLLRAEADGRPAAAGVWFVAGGDGGVFLVATQPDARGIGAATSIVAAALASIAERAPGATVTLLATSPRIGRPLESLGFRRDGEFAVYELPRDAELSLPPAGPPAAPRWRPPRGTSPSN